jgi:hypothetical protein
MPILAISISVLGRHVRRCKTHAKRVGRLPPKRMPDWRRTGAGLVIAYAGEMGVETLLHTRLGDSLARLSARLRCVAAGSPAGRLAGKPAPLGSAFA